jgi:peptidoglycan hydrolase-like protein with peptidoglycan-binding domain
MSNNLAAPLQGPLHLGSVGPHVWRVQSRLNELLTGASIRPLVADGQFGRLTDQRVKALQRQLRLTVDGVVGSRTSARMGFTNFIRSAPTAPVAPAPGAGGGHPVVVPAQASPGPQGSPYVGIVAALVEALGAVGRTVQRVVSRIGNFANGIIDPVIGFIRNIAGQLAAIYQIPAQMTAQVAAIIRSIFDRAANGVMSMLTSILQRVGDSQVAELVTRPIQVIAAAMGRVMRRLGEWAGEAVQRAGFAGQAGAIVAAFGQEVEAAAFG